MTQAIDISGLTLKQVNENIADKTFTVAQVKAAITKAINPKMRPGAKARWTRALEQLSTKGAKGIDIGSPRTATRLPRTSRRVPSPRQEAGAEG